MPHSAESYPVLIAQSGPLNGERWVVRNQLTIGRGEDCEVIIPDRKISRHHARLIHGTDGITLEDLDSKNGTHHNGKPLKGRVLLSDGDLIQIALAQKFTFLSSDATVPLDFDIPAEVPEGRRRLHMDKRSRRVWAYETEVDPPLSVAQFSMLEMLYLRDGLVVTRDELVRHVWQEDEALSISDQALDALIRRLRERLAKADPSHEYVVTVRGHGLRLDNPLQEDQQNDPQ
ncbi:MAG TPA: FHA domain-containing protein [Anaerolineales bacterium]|nr:FHA domain-containing protein [Anaerolineales bacterium]HRQ91923.1 FHA domain-containing protein [Anaerolineales bacterium]